jgi:hypothetical protein
MSKWQEKCKDEAETASGKPSGGTNRRPATSVSSNKAGKKVGSQSRPSGKSTRDNPPLDFTPKTTKAGNPKVKRRAPKSGGARGGDRALRWAAKEAVTQADALKDTLREQKEETRMAQQDVEVAQEAAVHLRRDLTNVQEDLKQAEKKLELRRNRMDERNALRRKTFHCSWQDETAEATLTFWLFVLIFPAIFVSLATFFDMIEGLMCWQWVIASMLYQVAAVFADRQLCAKRGYRAKFCKRITHSYDAVSDEEWDDIDRRADSMSLRELKHVDARYSIVAYRKTLNGVNLNTNSFGERTGRPDYLLISHELLAQLTTPNVMLTDDKLVVKSRLDMSVKTIHTVNIDKDLYQQGKDVARNTADVAEGIWYQNRQSRPQLF